MTSWTLVGGRVEGAKNRTDKHGPRPTEFRRKRKKCSSAVNGTKMGAEKAFHTQDPTINQRSDVPVTALATTLTGSDHKIDPSNLTITSSRNISVAPHPVCPSNSLLLLPREHTARNITTRLCNKPTLSPSHLSSQNLTPCLAHKTTQCALNDRASPLAPRLLGRDPHPPCKAPPRLTEASAWRSGQALLPRPQMNC